MKECIIFCLSLLFALSFSQRSTGQSGVFLDLEALDFGRTKTISATGENGELSRLSLRKTQMGTELLFDFNGINASRAKINFYSKGQLVSSEEAKGGPLGIFDIDFTEEILFSKIVERSDKQDWWWGILLVAYCCLELDTNSEVISDENGNPTGITSSWSIGFDCDCISISIGASYTGPDGVTNTYTGVDRITITPLDGSSDLWNNSKVLKEIN